MRKFLHYYINHYVADVALAVFSGLFLFFFVGISLQDDRTIFLKEPITPILIMEIIMTACIMVWMIRRIIRKLKEENEHRY